MTPPSDLDLAAQEWCNRKDEAGTEMRHSHPYEIFKAGAAWEKKRSLEECDRYFYAQDKKRKASEKERNQLKAEVEQLTFEIQNKTSSRDNYREMVHNQQAGQANLVKQRDAYREQAEKLAKPLKGFVEYGGGFKCDNEEGAKALADYEALKKRIEE